MRVSCPLTGECRFAGICEANDTSLIFDAVLTSPEMQIMVPVLDQEQINALARPVIEAWNADPCLKEKVRSLKELQFQDGISHVSMTMGTSVLDKVSDLLDVH